MAYSNIEKLPGKTHYTGYATVCGASVVYHIRRDGKKWEGRPARVFAVAGHRVPTIRGDVLGEISSALLNLELQYPKPN